MKEANAKKQQDMGTGSIPKLLAQLAIPAVVAQVINLLFFLPAAAAGLWFHREKGLLDAGVRRQAALPGVIAALAGAWIGGVMGVQALRRPFGLFLILSAG